MKKALVLSFFISLLCMSVFADQYIYNGYSFEYETDLMPEYPVEATIKEVISGDLFLLDYYGTEEKLSLKGIKIDPDNGTAAKGLAELLLPGQKVMISYSDQVRNESGNLCGYMWLQGTNRYPIFYNHLLTMYGFSSPSESESKYTETFKRAHRTKELENGSVQKCFKEYKCKVYSLENIKEIYPDLENCYINRIGRNLGSVPSISIKMNPITIGESLLDKSTSTITTGRKRVGAICNDGTRSEATGSGACSHHGGVREWIYE